MKYPHNVPLWRTNEELLAGQFFSQVVLSVGTGWNEVVLEQHRLPSSELADLTYRRHVVVINLGHSSTWEFEKDGVSAGPKGKRRDFLLSKPSVFFWSAESREGRVYEYPLSGSEPSPR
jgi:hypothetical protein